MLDTEGPAPQSHFLSVVVEIIVVVVVVVVVVGAIVVVLSLALSTRFSILLPKPGDFLVVLG